jgi:hypothetical protein
VSERLATIEHELCLARIHLGRAVRVENGYAVGTAAWLEIAEIVDELLARIEQLVLTRAHVLAAIRRHEGSTLQ